MPLQCVGKPQKEAAEGPLVCAESHDSGALSELFSSELRPCCVMKKISHAMGLRDCLSGLGLVSRVLGGVASSLSKG